MTIQFYSINGDFGCFSNFARYSLQLKGKTWATSEHYFQSQKFAGTQYESKIRKCKSPKEAASMGRDRSLPLRRDWESVKDNIMRAAVLAKFQQNTDIQATLLATQEEKIIEHTENDSYWGDGGNGSGKNRLGQILMEVRTILRNSQTDKQAIYNYINQYGLQGK